MPFDAQVTPQGGVGFANHAAMICNAQNMWVNTLRDSQSDSDIIVNAAGTLRHEDERRIAEKVTEVRERELNGVQDLISAGLTRNEDIGTQLMGVENSNDFQIAEQSMNPTQLQNNNTDFELEYTPLPITHSSFRIPWRQTGFSYKNAIGMNRSVRNVSERLEKTLFEGNPSIVVKLNGVSSVIYGYTTHPARSIQSISDWSLPANADKIISDTSAMLTKAFLEGKVSKVNSMVMYVAPNIWNILDEDYSAQKGDKTFMERIKSFSAIRDIKVGEYLGDGEVLLVEMNDRTIELGIATDVITVPHSRTSPVEDQVITTYAAMQATIKQDRGVTTGIVHGVPA